MVYHSYSNSSSANENPTKDDGCLFWELCFASRVGNPHRSKSSRFGLLRSIPKNIAPPGNAEIFETRFRYFVCQLCFQQSAGNSTHPQFGFLFCIGWERLLNQNVSNLNPATVRQLRLFVTAAVLCGDVMHATRLDPT